MAPWTMKTVPMTIIGTAIDRRETVPATPMAGPAAGEYAQMVADDPADATAAPELKSVGVGPTMVPTVHATRVTTFVVVSTIALVLSSVGSTRETTAVGRTLAAIATPISPPPPGVKSGSMTIIPLRSNRLMGSRG